MSDSVGVICNGGVCSELPPEVALAMVALDSLVRELNSKRPFGENNEIVKLLQSAVNDIRNGAHDTNEAVKIIRNTWQDITQGFGDNNDVRRFFEQLGIRL